MNRLYFEFDQKSDLIFTMIDPIPRTLIDYDIRKLWNHLINEKIDFK